MSEPPTGRQRSISQSSSLTVTSGVIGSLERPAVQQAAVIGVRDERLGQVGHAFVVRRHGHQDVTEQQIIDWAEVKMAGFNAPRYVEFLQALPLNATGKVMKDQLK